MVARWETGRRIPTPYWRTHLGVILRLPPEALDRAAAAAKAQRAHLAGAAAPARPTRSGERLRYILAHSGSVDLVGVAHLREQIRRLDEQYDRAPSTVLIADAGQYLGQVVFLAGHVTRGYVQRELHAAEAEAATLMGQLVWDASPEARPRHRSCLLRPAISAARQRGDKPAEVLALLRESFVALYGKAPRMPLPPRSTRRLTWPR
jgi:hypothetical protein